jgi:hypothetical protein
MMIIMIKGFFMYFGFKLATLASETLSVINREAHQKGR